MQTLFNSREWLLFLALFIFAFLLPSLKYMLLLIYGLLLGRHQPSKKVISVLEAISKWAMLDVFIIAILIASIKLKSLAAAQTHYGLYLFMFAVLVAMGCTYYYKHVLSQSK